jgi:alkanesulfonate monooxygenase SsuD/methylene tetrahydromethanopterin reductase-like flavin-dependent oxidoreductase (luciferase family)
VQGHPVIIQAGQSGRGRRFAGQWGEVIFATAPNLEFGKRGYKALKDEAADAGRDPDSMVVCNLVLPVCAETRAAAEDKMALIQQLPLEIDQLSLLSEGLNFDFASKGMDEPLTDAELASISGLQSIRDRLLAAGGRVNPTTRDFISSSHRGRPDDAVVGGPKEVADVLEELFAERVCDGFVVAATHVPGGYADFVCHVVPELQRRGIFHTEYTGTTLRESLGLPRPAVGTWRHSVGATSRSGQL